MIGPFCEWNILCRWYKEKRTGVVGSFASSEAASLLGIRAAVWTRVPNKRDGPDPIGKRETLRAIYGCRGYKFIYLCYRIKAALREGAFPLKKGSFCA